MQPVVVQIAKWRYQLSRLRFEEFLALMFFLPMVLITTKAYVHLKTLGNLTRRVEGGVYRIAVSVLVFIIFATILKRWKFIRDWLPFAFCIAIYTNLHDTIHFVNPNDVHQTLIAIDGWLFGMQPSVWAEQFITPFRTDFFTFCYSLFFAFGPSVALALYVKQNEIAFRQTMLSVILGFYIGYVLYIIFPAASPCYAIPHLYTVNLKGQHLESTRQIIQVAAHKSRDAFPSLHTAGTLIALICAWRYVRWMFWTLLPFAVGLIVSTIYLRYHYVIDLIAGALLAPLAVWIGARADNWWDICRNCYIRPKNYGPAEDFALKTTHLY